MATKKRHKKVAKITQRQAKITPKKKGPDFKKDPNYQKQKGELKIRHDQEEIPKDQTEVAVSDENKEIA